MTRAFVQNLRNPAHVSGSSFPLHSNSVVVVAVLVVVVEVEEAVEPVHVIAAPNA
jgi:hypothetical protein